MEGFALAFIVLAFVSFPADASDLQVLCEGNDLSGWVKCEENHVLHIATAKYGRDSDIMCEGVNSSAMCGMHDVYDIIRPVCEGKQRCDSFIVNRENLGTIEKCKHVNIYLKMFTGCIPFCD
ncbi:uncharacterized protein LOC114535785 isoform X2 [Dendronephthya gigantea]|uniref:uncharacterized protein LOC114535785 isoform X2 n=1 Tax=Dendronephthya gigantea TaxID=151771 RepID=UPI00106D3071|nr:uncharacterized protein LOC114535785 isoform X2 [Dendronephthya gigantea]